MKKVYAMMALLSLYFVANAQVTDMGGPIGWKNKLPDKNVAIVEMPGFDLEQAHYEDSINDVNKVGPWRFGYEYATDYNLNNSGTWTMLPNGDRVWRILIKCPDAQTINLQFENFYMPEGGFVYMYDTDQTNRVGAYTNNNHNPDGRLGTELVHGDEVILEYFEPASVMGQGHFTISMVVHGYRSAKEYAQAMLGKGVNDSGDCNIDVNCPLGVGWENQIRSVGMLVNGGGFCTGALINNTCDDGTGYFLTANHCGTASGSWNVRWNWESPPGTESCATTAGSTNPGTPYDQTSNGATPVVQGNQADHNLIEINNFSITDAQNWNLFYAGWDNSDAASVTQGTGIHHPSGDLKKICREDNGCTQENWNGAACWRVSNWDQGVTEPGSSGSPLFDQNGRIIGQLYGGGAACSGTNDNGQPDWYGRFGVSWGLGFSTYLAPGSCGSATTNDGFDPNASTVTDDAGIQSITYPTGLICSGNFDPEVVLRNYGTDPLTSCTINYDVDAGPNNTFNWTGNLAPGTTTTVALPTMSAASGPHTFNASTELPNGVTDPNSGNDGSSGNFTLQTNGLPITLTLNTDCWGSEITWEIQDGSSNVMISGGPYTDVTGGETIVVNTCLDPGCYDFIINDSYGDGMYGTQWGCAVNGDYTIEDGSANVLASIQAANSDFGDQEVNNFCLTNPCPGTVNSTVTDVLCNGGNDGSIDVSVTGGDAPHTFDIGGGAQGTGLFTNLNAGSYTVTIVDNNACSQDVNLTVNEPTAISDAYNVTHVISGNDGAIDLTMSGGTPPYSYNWTGPNSFSSSTEDPNGLDLGFYDCVITDANGCVYNVTGVEVSSQSNVQELTLDFTIYPNPSNGVFNVELFNSDEDITVTILDLTGRLIYTEKIIGKSMFTIDISDKAEGTYFLRITEGNKQTAKPIVNQK